MSHSITFDESISLFGWTNKRPTTNLVVPRICINILCVFFTRSALKAVYVHKGLVPLSVSNLQGQGWCQMTLLVFRQNLKKRRV